MNTTEKQNEGIPIITKKIWSKAKPLTVKPYEGQADCTCYLTTDQVFEIFKELAIPLDAVVMPKIAEDKLRQLFKDNSDCYADTSTTGSVYQSIDQAMTEDKFVEVINKLSNLSA